MTFQDEIKNYEFSNSPYIIKMGLTPVVIITPKVNRKDTITKTITRYVSNQTESSFLININETNIEENIKPLLLNIVNNQNIKLLISINITAQDNGFDLEIETSKNLSAMFNTIKHLEQNFKKNNLNAIYNKNYHEEFKYNSVDIIQITLNQNHIKQTNLENICNSLTNFITEYLQN